MIGNLTGSYAYQLEVNHADRAPRYIASLHLYSPCPPDLHTRCHPSSLFKFSVITMTTS